MKNMDIQDIFKLFTGVALFLFGMSLMGEGLKKVAGKRMEMILFHLTGSKLKAVVFGTGVTTVIQSSSAVSIMAVGFVNSGVMKTAQSIPVVLGAILGTSITGWILCLSYISTSSILSLFSGATITCVCAISGIYFKMFSKNKQKNRVGTVLLGFATLMTGMTTMSDSMSAMQSNPAFVSTISAVSHPVPAFLIGLVFTVVLQSSSATVGILQALSLSGVISFEMAFPMLLGICIGASVPVLLSALNSKAGGKLTAFSYLVLTIIGSAVTALLFYVVHYFVRFGFYNVIVNPVSIAVVNTVIRIVIVICLFPFTEMIEKLIALTIKTSGTEEKTEMKPLEESLIKYPAMALEQSREAINHMAETAEKNIQEALALFSDYSEDRVSRIENLEDMVDRYEDKLSTYLLKLTAQHIDMEQNNIVGQFLHTVTDFERLSDHAVNLSLSAKELVEEKLNFSETFKGELNTLTLALVEILNMSINSFISNDLNTAVKVEPLEQVIDDLIETVKNNHIKRIQEGSCQFTASFAFNDILSNYERIADHCSNIAVAVIAVAKSNFETHMLLGNAKKYQSEGFKKTFEEFSEKYQIDKY